jgi:transposase
MKRFVEGISRQQATLFPECLEDWIDGDNPVRVIDAFVDRLDLVTLGFDGAVAEATGRPSYHPAGLLKLYIYGYLNRVQSSRRLEREAGRNVEVMWLTGRLIPDHKTIADFRKDSGVAIKQVCVQFIELCRRRTQLQESVSRYLAQLDTADRQEPSEELAAKTEHLKEKLVKLEGEMQRLAAMEKMMLASHDQQISLTDPDSRSMATSGRGSGVVGYNVQVAVDTEHHLIITHEVTNIGSDRAQLANIASQAKHVLGVDKLEAVADRGYYSGEEILACDNSGIAVTLPKPMTSGMEARGRFGKQDFVYLAEEDVYRCPAGKKLSYHYTNEEDGQQLRRYWTNVCSDCALKPCCTSGKERRITRWEHEHVLEAVQQRLDRNPQAMRQRRETVEHPFGTLKMRMGATHFLMKRLPKVASEMALHVLAYNLTRVMNIIDTQPLIAAIKA